MNVHLPAPGRRWPARLVNLAVVAVVLALAAATFVLSYTGVHVIALQAGVSARYARVYPATFDAVLIIACVAAVMLRGARWWVRCYAWLAIILLVAVIGAADAVHAMNVALPQRTTEGVVAATPWVLVLLGFSLMLTMLRHSRAQHAASPQARRASRGDATRAAEQATRQLWAAIEQPAAGRQTPASDGTTAPNAAPDLEAIPAFDASRAFEPDATKTAPGSGDDPDEPTVSWHDYWDAEPERGSGGQTDPPAATDPEDRHHPPTADPEERHHPPTADPEERHHPATTDPKERHHLPTVADAAEPAHGSQSATREVDADAPPFAIAPFAPVPRLNRVRSTPTPPEEDAK